MWSSWLIRFHTRANKLMKSPTSIWTTPLWTSRHSPRPLRNALIQRLKSHGHPVTLTPSNGALVSLIRLLSKQTLELWRPQPQLRLASPLKHQPAALLPMASPLRRESRSARLCHAKNPLSSILSVSWLLRKVQSQFHSLLRKWELMQMAKLRLNQSPVPIHQIQFLTWRWSTMTWQIQSWFNDLDSLVIYP